MKKWSFTPITMAGVFVVVLSICSFAAAQDRVVVVPLGGKKCSSPTENSFTNSIGMTFNLLPAGTFTMGSPDDEPGGPYSNEQPEHEVIISKSFYMQTTEVTQEQWQAIVRNPLVGGANPSRSNIGDNYPVEYVNWFEAASFANWLSVSEGRTPCYNGNSTCTGSLGINFTCSDVTINASCTGYRLPTEAQWEYAARATTTTAWAYAEIYDDSADPGQVIALGFNSNLDAMGWYEFNNDGGDLSRDAAGYPSGTKPVAKKQANKWGLYDMAGNVREWCQDWYDINYYSDPTSGTDPQGPDTGSGRVIRSGSWNSSAGAARSAGRLWDTPGLRNDELGFRLVLPPGQ